MATTSVAWQDETRDVAGAQLRVFQGGSGPPLVILHDEIGHPGPLPFHDALAQSHTVHLPCHPGFGETDGLEWTTNVRDFAGWYLEALDDLGLDRVALMGYGLGGWMAAEMATMSPQQFSHLVVVGAPGLKPPTGEIFDMFLVVARAYITASFHDPDNNPQYQAIYGGEPTPAQLDAWEYAREEASRLTWRPYMHYPGLAPLLHRLKRVPTLIVWGRDDKIVPVSAGEAYQAAIPGSQLVVLDDCGHHPEMEQTDAFIQHVQAFLGGA